MIDIVKLILTDDQRSRWNIKDQISCIYKLTNLDNGKVYIGQTVNLRKRVPEYNNAETSTSDREIIKAIKKHGSNRFRLEIVEECDPKNLSCYESYHIRKLEAYDPKYGYNENLGSMSRDYEAALKQRIAMKLYHTGLKESPLTKRKKSQIVIAINEDTRDVIISDSGKLLGDYFDKSKDYIKNCLRQPSTIQGYQLYYYDKDLRDSTCRKILDSKKMRSDRYKRLWDVLSACEYEGVETISLLLSKVYDRVSYLFYGISDSSSGKPALIPFNES